MESTPSWEHDGKRVIAALLALMLTLFPPIAFANPQNGTVSAGQATVSQNGTKLDVHQSSDKTIIDWRSFDIEAGEHTQFYQPSASSIALNRVNSNDPSRIMGQLSANGQVILINPNGVFFGQHSRVDVAGIVATTANIRNSDFMAGKLHFFQPGNPNAMIVNHGMITAKEAGLVGLVAPYVENHGIINARLGRVALASGDSFTLDMAGDNLIEVAVSGNLHRQIVSNYGTINAEGGRVSLTAATARKAVDSVVSNHGLINANRFKQKDGKIILYAAGSNAVKGNVAANKGKETGTSTALNSGTLTATGDKGGTVEVLGDHVGLLSGSRIDVSGKTGGGTVLIGGDYQGNGTTPTAKRTIIQSNTVINANAVENGKGGKVIAWADDRTDFGGGISARGGAWGGDGGFIETSGKQILSVSGLADASSPHGKAGLWLLDPNNVTIQTAGSDTNVSASPNFTTTNDTAIVTTGSIETALNAGTSVTITTSTGGTNAQLGDITVANAIAKTAGGDATLTLSAHGSIIVSSGAHITSNTGKLHIVFNADSDADGAGAISVSSANLTSNGGNITLGGGANPYTTAAYGTSVYASGITLTTAVLTSGAGNIILRGHGMGTAGNANQNGISLASTAVVQADGGSVTIHGTGGNGTSGNAGVKIITASKITSTTGTLEMTGIGGNGSSINNYGIFIRNANSVISSNGSTTMTVNGTGGTGTDENTGLKIEASAKISATTGTLTVTGASGPGSGTKNFGVYLRDATTAISTSGSANLVVIGTGSGGTSDNHGVYVFDSGTISSSTGLLTVNGTGGNGTNDNYGVHLASGGNISSSGGNISVTGIAGNGSTNRNFGVYVTDSDSVISSTGTGTLTINGTGGNGTTNNYGVFVNNAVISSTNTGTITVSGTGGNGTTLNHGVHVAAAGNITTGSSGNLVIRGIGGNGSDTTNYGVSVTGASSVISSTGTGTLTINGTGGNGTTNNYGIYIVSSGAVSTVNSTLAITGVGGTGSSTGNYGVYLNTASGIVSTGSGNITVTSTGKNSAIDFFGGGAYTIGGASATGAITMAQDTATWGGVILNTTGATTVKARTSGSTIGVAGAGGTLGVTTAFLDAILNASSVTVGDSTITGNITANAYSWGRTASLISGTGNLTINGTQTLGASSNFTANALNVTGGAYTIGGGSATGTITMIQDSATWGGLILNTTGATTVKAHTASTTIGIAGGAGTLGVTSAFLDAILNSSGITVGDTAGSGAITVNAYTWGRAATIVTATGGITFNGATAMGANTLLARTTGLSDITLDAASSITTSAAGNALILASGRNFINNSNGSALTTSVGRSLVYSTTPASDTLGGLARPTKRYNKTYAGYAPGSVTETGNVFLYSVAPTITLTADDQTRTYGTANPALTATITNGLIDGDTASDAYSGSAAISTAAVQGSDVNTYAITIATGTLASALGYQINLANGNLTVTQATLTVTGLTVSDKVYDTTTTATLGGTAALSGIYGADDVTIGGTAAGAFANKNAGAGKAITVTGNTLGGTKAANYTLVQQTGLTATITAAALTVTGLTTSDKVYDTTTTATLGGTAALSGIIGADVVTIGGTAAGAFANKNVGAGKAVTVTGNTLGGADAANYTITQQTGLTATITAAALTVTGLTASNKTYNGNTTATLGGTAALSGIIGADVVTVGGTAAGTFANKNVGTGKAVTVTGSTLGGADAANYTITQQAGLTADITAASLTVTGLTASDKVYDTSTTATLGGTAALSGIIGADVVTVGGTAAGSFANKNAGAGKAVTVTGNTLGGAEAANYTLTQQVGLTATITAAALTVTGLTASNKDYDSTTLATLTGTAVLSALLGADVATLNGVAVGAFADSTAGTGKSVTVTGLTLAGLDANNYTVTQPTGLTANIAAVEAPPSVYSGHSSSATPITPIVTLVPAVRTVPVLPAAATPTISTSLVGAVSLAKTPSIFPDFSILSSLLREMSRTRLASDVITLPPVSMTIDFHTKSQFESLTDDFYERWRKNHTDDFDEKWQRNNMGSRASNRH